MRAAFALCLTLWGMPAQADLASALDRHVVPAFTAFASAAEAFADQALANCSPTNMQPAYQAVFDAWMAVADLRIGPSETAALSIEFWPDTRGMIPKAIAAVQAEGESALDPATFEQHSVAARGLMAAEWLIYNYDVAGPEACPLRRAVAQDLAVQADALAKAWIEDFLPLMRNAGGVGNATYLSRDEALRALYTQVIAGLDYIEETRIARPLGTFDRPRPSRAEAWRSGRPLRNIRLASETALKLAQSIALRPLPKSEAAFEKIKTSVAGFTDPTLQVIAIDPGEWLKLEILGQQVAALKQAIEEEVGGPMNLSPGFNALDGD